MQGPNTDTSFNFNIPSSTLQNVRIASNRRGSRDAYFAKTNCYDILSQPSSFMSLELAQDFHVCVISSPTYTDNFYYSLLGFDNRS